MLNAHDEHTGAQSTELPSPFEYFGQIYSSTNSIFTSIISDILIHTCEYAAIIIQYCKINGQNFENKRK